MPLVIPLTFCFPFLLPLCFLFRFSPIKSAKVKSLFLKFLCNLFLVLVSLSKRQHKINSLLQTFSEFFRPYNKAYPRFITHRILEIVIHNMSVSVSIPTIIPNCIRHCLPNRIVFLFGTGQAELIDIRHTHFWRSN